MKTQITFAKNINQAQDYINEYWPDHTQIINTTYQCACGESSCMDYFNGSDSMPVEKVVICESCYLSAALHDRV